MTDSSSFANSLTEPLRQPLWWAALASVSIHGVLGVSAPTISNLIYGGNSKNRPGSVGLIELTPSEVGRLPQTIPAKPSNNFPFSISPVPPPRINPTPLVPPAPPIIGIPATPPGMPPPGFFSPGLLPPPTSNNPSPPTSQAAIPKNRPPKPPSVILQQPPNNLIIPPRPSDFDRNIPPPPSLTPQFPPPANPGSLDEGEALEKLRDAQGRLPLFPDGAPVFTPEFPIGPRSSESGDRVPKLTQKDPNKRGQFPETPEEIARRRQFESEQRNFQPRQPGSGLPASREEQLAATEKYISLFEQFKRAYPNLEMTGPTPLNIPYPAAACAQKLEGVAVFGAVVNPQGGLQALPEGGTIVSTGYSILDEAVKRVLIDPAWRYSPGSTYRLYQFGIEFKYDTKICGGTPPTRSPAPTQAQPIGPQSPAPVPAAPTNRQPSPAPVQVKPNFEKEAKPAPVPRQPSPGPQPAPRQQPSPQPQPTPVQRPTPAPEEPLAPVDEPSPAIQESPPPVVEPSLTPEPTPTPIVEPSPTPEPIPTPAAESTPTPEAVPSPATEPTPTPTPSPAG